MTVTSNAFAEVAYRLKSLTAKWSGAPLLSTSTESMVKAWTVEDPEPVGTAECDVDGTEHDAEGGEAAVDGSFG